MGKFLTDEQVMVLKQAHKTIRDKRLADRIKAVLYLNYGLSYPEIAKLLLLDEVTLRRHVKEFKKMQFSQEFIDAVVRKTKERLENTRKTADSLKQGMINQKTAFENKRNKLESEMVVYAMVRMDWSNCLS